MSWLPKLKVAVWIVGGIAAIALVIGLVVDPVIEKIYTEAPPPPTTIVEGLNTVAYAIKWVAAAIILHALLLPRNKE